MLPDEIESVYENGLQSSTEENTQPATALAFSVPDLPAVDVRDGTSQTRPLSELGNAYRLLDNHVGDVYCVAEAKAYVHWAAGAWRWDLDGAVVRGMATKLPEQIYREGEKFLAEAEAFAKWSRNSQKQRTIEAAVALFRDFDRVRIPLSVLDADTFKVGLDDGRVALDLTTGTCSPALQNHFITKSLAVNALGRAADAVRWHDFLKQVFGDDAELVDWLKRWCGYMLTGSTAEQVFVFCFGLGANGKSVLADTIRFIMGDYARAIAAESLTESKRQAGGATPDLAELIGARLAMSSETEDGGALAESLIKSLVAGDVMSVRKLYAAPIQFTPQFKLMMLGNHKPVIRGNDYGIWRRVRLIPFRRTFKPEERDPDLLNKLKAEAPHILAWMVEGCLDWRRRGLRDIPETIHQATGQYQEEQDLFGRWLSECCLMQSHAEATSTALYSSYKQWAFNNGLRPASNVALGRRLSERGFGCRQSHGKRIWSGVGVLAEDIATKQGADGADFSLF